MKKINLFNKYILDENGNITSLYSQKLLTPRIRNNKKSYMLSGLDNKHKSYMLHILMATNFFDNFNGDTDKIIFKDNDSLNCSLSNLEIETTIPKYLENNKSVILNDNYILFETGDIFSKLSNKMLSGNADKIRGMTISLNGKSDLVHLLVAENFIPDFDRLNDLVQFKDEDRTNCHIDNLEIIKLGFIRQKNDEASTLFFEQQDPYKIARRYLGRYIKQNGGIYYNPVFDYEDFIQTMVIKLYESTPSYLLKYGVEREDYQGITFNSFAYRVFDGMFKNFNSIWIDMYSLSSVIEVENQFTAEEYVTSISILEAGQCGIIELPDNK